MNWNAKGQLQRTNNDGVSMLSVLLRRMRELRGSKQAYKYAKRASWHKLPWIKSLKHAMRDLGNMRNFVLCCWMMYTIRKQVYAFGLNSVYTFTILQCKESPRIVFTINNCAVRNSRDNCFWCSGVYLDSHVLLFYYSYIYW